VRSYGKAINLPDDVLIDCLDLVELGSYSRQLIDYFEASQKKKGKKSPIKEQVILDDTVDPNESTYNKSISNTSTANTSTSGKPSKGELTANDESDSRGKDAVGDSSGDNAPANSTSASSASSPQPVSTPSFKKPPVDGVDWASKPLRGQTRTPIPPHVWVLGAVSTLLIMAIITLVWWFSQRDTNSGDSTSGSAPTSEPTELNQEASGELGSDQSVGQSDNRPNERSSAGSEASAVTAATSTNATSSSSGNDQNGSGPSNPSTELAPTTTESPQPNESPLTYLGSSPLNATYSVLIYAANGRLEPIRVWSDQKPEIDPYWIEQGHAMRFEMDQEMRLSGQFSNLRLIVNGRDLGPISPNSAQNGIPTFTLNLSTPQMASVPRDPQPLNLEQDLQIPSEFVDRPTFE
jgi:hypothetical protein